MAMAAGIISGVFGMVGSVVQASAMAEQAAATERIAEWNARRQEEAAAREQAAGQMRAQLQRREGERVSSKARAAMAQGGAVTSAGTPLLLDQEITKEAEFNANIEIANAQDTQRDLENRAISERYEGQVRAQGLRSQASASLVGGIGSMFKAFG